MSAVPKAGKEEWPSNTGAGRAGRSCGLGSRKGPGLCLEGGGTWGAQALTEPATGRGGGCGQGPAVSATWPSGMSCQWLRERVSPGASVTALGLASRLRQEAWEESSAPEGRGAFARVGVLGHWQIPNPSLL